MSESGKDATREPTHGYTKDGQEVHGKVIDHHRTDSTYQRFNKAVALWLTKNVGTMTCFWVFCALSLTVLPSVLYAMGLLNKRDYVPAFMLTFGFELMMTWVISTTIQVILLPAVMVGQNLQSEASDARAARTFDDTERLIDLLNTHTDGGLKTILDAIEAKNNA